MGTRGICTLLPGGAQYQVARSELGNELEKKDAFRGLRAS